MLKISKNASVKITTILCWAVLIFMVALTLCLPYVWSFVISVFKINSPYYLYSLCLLYPACILGIIACVFILSLLKLVGRGEVFSELSISKIRGISWCCILVTPLFAAIGVFFYTFFVFAALTLFLGLIVRVVKNVIEEATALKAENDLTV